MQIRMGTRRVDFYGNKVSGVRVELVGSDGVTFLSRKLSEEERIRLVDTLTRSDNGSSV